MIGLHTMKATFQALFNSFKTTFSEAVVNVVFKFRNTDGLLASATTLSALGFSSPDTPNKWDKHYG